MKVIFVRHGQTNYNLLCLCNDDPTVDVHLTKLGMQQAKTLAARLKDEEFDSVIVSELPRTQETAAIITKGDRTKFRIEPRINDRKTGCEGKPVFDFFIKALAPDLFHSKLNGGESFQEEKERVFSFLEELKEAKEENILIVSHSEIIQIVKGYFNNYSDQEMFDTKIDNCEILEFNL